MSINFSKLFQEADQISSPSIPIISYENTEEFAAAYKKKSFQQVEVNEPDIEQLKKRRICLPKEDNSDFTSTLVLGYCTKQLSIPKTKLETNVNESVRQPYYNWEKEVREAMEIDEVAPLPAKDQISSIPLLPVRTRIRNKDLPINSLVPYSSFDPDFIDVNRVSADPLEQYYFPKKSQISTIDEIDPYISSDDSKAPDVQPRNNAREKLFTRFTSKTIIVTKDQLENDLEESRRQQEEENRANELKQEERRRQLQGIDTWIDVFEAVDVHSKQHTNERQKRNKQPIRLSVDKIAPNYHARAVLQHKNCRADLKEIELKYFHRPRFLLGRDKNWTISLKQQGKREKKSSILRDNPGKAPGSLASSAEKLILVEYTEEFPPIQLNRGMASVLVNYARPAPATDIRELDADEQDDNNNEGGGTSSSSKKRKSSLKEPLTSEEIARMKRRIMTNPDETIIPRHLLRLWELDQTKRSYETTVRKLQIGISRTLKEKDPSPLLGDIPQGDSQLLLETNLFRVPLFYHRPETSDFFLIQTIEKKSCTKDTEKGKNSSFHFSLQDLPKDYPSIFVSGQMEPQMIVPAPSAKLSLTQENLLKLSLLRFLQKHSNGVTFQEVLENILKYSAKETISPHKQSHRNAILDLLRKHSMNKPDLYTNEMKYYPKEIYGDNKELSELIDDLCGDILAEDICLQESCDAAEYRLLQENITNIPLHQCQSFLQFLHEQKQFYLQREESLEKALLSSSLSASSSSSSSMAKNRLKLQEFFLHERMKLEKKQTMARFLFERLAAAPWNTSEAFVHSIVENDQKGRMDIQRSQGDPLGHGDGYAFIRILNPTTTANATNSNSGNHKESLTGDKDLRRITNERMFVYLKALGMKLEDSKKLKRYQRVRLFSRMVEKLVANGLLNNNELLKYIRDPVLREMLNGKASLVKDPLKISLENFRNTCNEIWQRQKKALSMNRFFPQEEEEEEEQGSNMQESSMVTGSTQNQENSEANDENDDDDDDDLAILRALSNRKPIASSSSLGRHQQQQKEQQQIEAQRQLEEERRALQQFHRFLDEKKTTSPSTPPTNDTAPIARSYPGKILKRITRSVDASGKETIRIEFIFLSPEELQAVTTRCQENNLKRKEKAHRTALSQHPNALSPSKAVTKANNSSEQLNPLTINLLPATNLNPISAPTGGKRRKNSRKGQDGVENEEDRRHPHEEEDAELKAIASMKKKKSSKRSGTLEIVNPRLPRVSLAVKLEQELMKFFDHPEYLVLLHTSTPPLSSSSSSSTEEQQRPCCLHDLRENIVRWKYENHRSFLEDCSGLLEYFQRVHGPHHPLSQIAGRFVQSIRSNILTTGAMNTAIGDIWEQLEMRIQLQKKSF